MSKLTNTKIKNAKGKDKPYSLGDGLGLSLLINPNGSKYWRFRFQFDGKAKMMSLGTYPDVSLAQVREKLREARTMVSKGLNPIDKNSEPKSGSRAFKEVAKAFLHQFNKGVSSHHYKRSESLLRLYATPMLGDFNMDDINHKDVRRVIVTVADAGKKESAKKLYGVLNQLFTYAVNHDECDVNVCKLIDTNKMFISHNKRKFPTITDPRQVKMLLDNIERFKGNHYSTKYGLLFMAYTSLRSKNVRHARWEQIDLENQTMTIAKEEMKISKSMLHLSEDFVLPLSTQTVELLNEVKKISGHGKYIFPSVRGDRPMSENAMLTYIRNLGYTKEQFTPHGFRSMFATIANDKSEFNRDIIDAQLAHKVGSSVSQSYNRTDYLEKRRELVQWWADWLKSISS